MKTKPCFENQTTEVRETTLGIQNASCNTDCRAHLNNKTRSDLVFWNRWTSNRTQLSLALTPKLLFHIAYIGKRKELETVLIPSKDQTTLSLQTSKRWLWRDGETWTQGLLRERPWRVASGGREDFWRFKHFKLIRRDELCNRAFMIIVSVYLVFYQIIKATEVAGEPFFFWSHTVLTVLIWFCWNLVKIYKQSRRKKSLLNKNNSFILKWFKQLSYIKRGKQRVAKGKKCITTSLILQVKVGGKQKEKHFSREFCQKWKCKCSFLHWDCRISTQE